LREHIGRSTRSRCIRNLRAQREPPLSSHRELDSNNIRFIQPTRIRSLGFAFWSAELVLGVLCGL
jgi:hypothetical protein